MIRQKISSAQSIRILLIDLISFSITNPRLSQCYRYSIERHIRYLEKSGITIS